MNYECIKRFVVEYCDENDLLVKNKHLTVKEGELWERQEHPYMSEVRLCNYKGRWLEISLDDLQEYFLEVKVVHDSN